MKPLLEVVLLFLRLGFTAFGGPAAHIAMYHDEVVKRRRWLDEQHFLDLLAACNLIPGPNSTEMVIHISYLRAGWPGFFLGGLAFIVPAVGIVLALAWAYVRYGSTPQAAWLMYGIQPVILAVIGQALWDLGRKAIRDKFAALVALAVLGLHFLGIHELLLLAAGGLIVMLVRNRNSLLPRRGMTALLPVFGFGLAGSALAPFGLPALFMVFLKIGAILYGSGYVLLAFLRADLVERLGWLTDQQLLQAIAVGQITPGPLFTSATFIGYLLGGLPGALLATLGIFLPAFIYVAISNPLIPRLRASPWTGAFLDGVILASLGLMAAVSLQIGKTAIPDLPAALIALVALALLLRWRINATWLVLGGAALGFLGGWLR